MATKKAFPSLTDTYQRVGEASFKFLPLVIFELIVGVLRYGALIACLLITFGLFIFKYLNLLMNDPRTFDWGTFEGGWSARFTDWGWIAGFTILVLLYLSWWCLLSAVSDAGIFGCFVRYFRDGEAFSMDRFLSDMREFLNPILWLQVHLALYLVPALVFFFLTFGLIPAFWTVMDLSAGAAFLLSCLIGIPVLVLFLVFCFLFGVLYQTSVVYVIRGMEARTAIETAFQACRDNRWRIVVASMVLLLAYMGLNLGIHLVFGLLGLFPIIGLLFGGIGFLVGVALSLLWGIYVPALFALLVEEKES